MLYENFQCIWVFSPNFIHNLVNLKHVHMSKLTFFFCRAALDKATVLLSMSKGGKRKDSVWGSGGGQQSLNHLVKEVTTGHCLQLNLYVFFRETNSALQLVFLWTKINFSFIAANGKWNNPYIFGFMPFCCKLYNNYIVIVKFLWFL